MLLLPLLLVVIVLVVCEEAKVMIVLGLAKEGDHDDQGPRLWRLRVGSILRPVAKTRTGRRL